MVSRMSQDPDSFYRKAFALTATISCGLMVLLSFDYGIIWDEWIQSQYGKLVLRFLLSGGAATDCLTFGRTMYLYGGLFDTLTATVYGLLSGNLRALAASYSLQDLVLPHYFETRHVVNALFGFTAILFTGLLGKELRNWRTGFFSLLFILLSPRFFGNSMNNPKDIPFAMGYVLSLYAMVRYFKSWPRPKLASSLFLIMAVAIAINVKAGGLMLLCYLFLFGGGLWAWEIYQHHPFSSSVRFFSFLIGIAAAAYCCGLLFWPYGLLDPLHHPLKALAEHSVFTGARGTLLFEGRLLFNDQIPWYYLPKWIFISVPLYVHLGVLFFLIFARRMLKAPEARYILLVLFAMIFPPFYAIAKHSIIYDSWRHFLFIFPPLAVLTALSWDLLFTCFRQRSLKIFGAALLMLTLLEPASWMVRFHPHEYVYFNPLVGGLKGAYGRYETDYWGNSLRMGSEWLARYYKRSGLQRPIVVRADGEAISSAYYLIRDIGSSYVMSPKGYPAWDFWLALSRGVDPDNLKNGKWPPPVVLHEVTVDGVPLCAVVKNPARS